MGPVRTFWQVPNPVPVERWSRGELLALRGWSLIRWMPDGSVRLQSLSHGDVWHGPVFHADHKPLAQPDCGSGVYALKASRRPRAAGPLGVGLGGEDWLTGTRTWIWGWVALSGQVVEHADGYRAEAAVVRRLHLGTLAHLPYGETPETLAALIRQLEDRYQCPVKAGYWERRKATRVRWLFRAAGANLPYPNLVGPPESRPVPPPAPIVARPVSLSVPPPPPTATRPEPAPRPVALPRPVAQRPAPNTLAVVEAFRRAERELGAKWLLMGRGHCRRVSLRSRYSRSVRLEAHCWRRFTPHGARFAVIVFPRAIVARAARILRTRLEDLIGREY